MKMKMINFDTNTCKLIAFERGSRTQKKKASSSEGDLI